MDISNMMPEHFNPDLVEERRLPALLEPGVYCFRVDDIEMKDARSGGKYLNFKLRGVSDEEGNEIRNVLFEKFNIINDNPEAVTIGWEELTRMSRACGFDEAPKHNMRELIDHTFWARVRIEKAKPDSGYSDQNKVSEWLAPTSDAKPEDNQPAVASGDDDIPF